ncbi:transglutaminase domain-containing protein [Pseudoxanthomonas koreensis]|uniref:transglutaminase domain-containing protein n=1 Tax=Pseudoxanthomonas koreensis TaxID=266061 RepID=UPI001391FE2F|nr:transglutaminase domain-containing protein [Pseudoxanthomonas koreensis]KAF1689041.1 transglutaminase [Pseudoxanthomonas koreensis]
MRALTLIAALALGSSPVPAPATVVVEPAPAMPLQQDEVMALPPGLREEVWRRVVAPDRSPDRRLQRLVDFVFGDEGLQLQYDGTMTRTVAEVHRDRRGNCLSFALLFVALAREAGLEAQVQEVGEVLAWYQDQGVIYNSGHVNTGVRTGGQWRVVEVDSNIIATRDRPRGIDDRRAMAHFHNNRGVERMAAGDLAAARALLQAAMAAAPGFVPAWNNYGVLLTREGDWHGAERAYLRALATDPGHTATLSNLVTLYERNADPRRVVYARKLDRIRKSDPFHQFRLALQCENEGDFDCAINRYRRAIRLQSGQHQFHFGLARAYLLHGDLARAQRELDRALALGDTDPVRDTYRRKLEHLQRWREQASSQARH